MRIALAERRRSEDRQLLVQGFGMTVLRDDAAFTGASVRKPPINEPAYAGARCARGGHHCNCEDPRHLAWRRDQLADAGEKHP